MAGSDFAEYMRCRPAATVARRFHCRFVGVDGKKSALGAAVRQALPIVFYAGTNGGGKTACAVYDVLPLLAGRSWSCRNTGHMHTHATGCSFNPVTGNGCVCILRDVPPSSHYDGPPAEGATDEGEYVVWSTTRLLDGHGQDHPRYRPLRSLGDIARVEHAALLLDEVPGIADARDHQSMPNQIRKAIWELRRRDARCLITGVDFSAADARLRNIVQGVVQARGLARVRRPGSLWSESQLLRWTTYNRADFERFTQDARNRIDPLGTQFVWRPGHLLERSYDTLAPVLALSIASEAGACMVCGGSRPRPKCGCPMPDEGVEVLPGVMEVEGERGQRRRVLAINPTGVAS